MWSNWFKRSAPSSAASSSPTVPTSLDSLPQRFIQDCVEATGAFAQAWHARDPKAMEVKIYFSEENYSQPFLSLYRGNSLSVASEQTSVDHKLLFEAVPELDFLSQHLFKVFSKIPADYRPFEIRISNGAMLAWNPKTAVLYHLNKECISLPYRCFESIPTDQALIATLLPYAPTPGRWVLLPDHLSNHEVLTLLQRYTRIPDPLSLGPVQPAMLAVDDFHRSWSKVGDILEAPYCPLWFIRTASEGVLLRDRRSVGIVPDMLLLSALP